jgi:ferrous iron transport protein B
MGLTRNSTGLGAVDSGLLIRKEEAGDKVFALAGNPNVGKSTVFNALTGMNQHTGNWPGKTVATAQGRCQWQGSGTIFVDLPGTYSLLAHSAEEEAARDFLCFGGADGAVVVCDATCLERNLNLVLQVLEITPRTVVCVNLLDEAARKGILVDLEALEEKLGVPVVGTSARSGSGLDELMYRVRQVALGKIPLRPFRTVYPQVIEDCITLLEPAVREAAGGLVDLRWLSLRLLEGDVSLSASMARHLGVDISGVPSVADALAAARDLLSQQGWGQRELEEAIVGALVAAAEGVAAGAVSLSRENTGELDRRLDRIFTSRRTGIPVMLLLLALIFWLTITGANYPSQLLSAALFGLGDAVREALTGRVPPWLVSLLVDGVYRVLAWVVSVMLPPMAIFFPLFTLLEDFGYLPRVAFNLDRCFKGARACGKQALTMCMGFGCNAAGIVGCRIIDSPRERLIAIITNCFVPCNGRFPPPTKRKLARAAPPRPVSFSPLTQG